MQGNPRSYRYLSRRRPNVDLRHVERDLNRRFGSIRVGVEGGVGPLKNWRITTTRYRSDLSRIDTDIHAVVGLQRLNERISGRQLSYQRIKKTELSE